MIPIYLEVHADEELLAREPACWDQAANLLDVLARRAENEGARLSFRVRERFVEGDQSNFLHTLTRRGHEVGWHTHGAVNPALVEALKARGVHPTVGTPGLVQVGEKGRLDLLAATRQYADRITDRLERDPKAGQHFAYQGWLAWQPIPGLWSLDVSVSPFDWGVLKMQRRFGVRRVEHGRGGLRWDWLVARAKVWSGFSVPKGYSGFFGATFHDHNLCAPQSLAPLPAELDGLSRFLAAFGPRIIPSAQIPVAWPDHPEAHDTGPKPGLLRRGWLAVQRAPKTAYLEVSGRKVAYRHWKAESSRLTLVVVAGGKSGLEQELKFLGVCPADMVKRGISVVCFARTPGTSRLPGNPIHAEDTQAIIEHFAGLGPVGVLSWSAGLVPAVRACRREKVRFLIDVEGPVDRFSVVPPVGAAPELLARDVGVEAEWGGIEVIHDLERLSVPYVRVQGSIDHVHGTSRVHADRAVQAARGKLELFPGRIYQHGQRVVELVVRLVGKM